MKRIGLVRLASLFGVFCLLAACSGPGRDGREQVTATADGMAADYLAGVLSGRVQGAAVASQGDLMVVAGGVGGDPDWSSLAVVVDRTRPTGTMTLPTALADPSAAAVGQQVLIAGRACDDTPVRTDTGVACKGGRASAFLLDPTSVAR